MTAECAYCGTVVREVQDGSHEVVATYCKRCLDREFGMPAEYLVQRMHDAAESLACAVRIQEQAMDGALLYGHDKQMRKRLAQQSIFWKQKVWSIREKISRIISCIH